MKTTILAAMQKSQGQSTEPRISLIWLRWPLGTAGVALLAAGCYFGAATLHQHWQPFRAHPAATSAWPISALPQLDAKAVDLVALRRRQLSVSAPVATASAASDAALPAANSASSMAVNPAVHATNAAMPNPVNSNQPPLLSQLPDSLTQGLPPLNYSAHVYSTDPKRSYIQLNRAVLHQGDSYLGLTVVAIRYGDTLFRYRGQLVRMLALHDWQ